MINRARLLLNILYEYIISPTEYLLLGKARQAIFDQENLINNELTPAAKKDANGVTVVRVGPPIPFATRHLAVVTPKSKKHLKELLDDGVENDPAGRTIMDPFQSLLGNPSITNTTGHHAQVQLAKMRKFTGDTQGFKNIEKQKFKAVMENWCEKKEGFVLLDEIKLLIRRVTYNRFITKEKELSAEINEQVNAGFGGLKKVLLDPYSVLTRINFFSVAKKYRADSKKFVDAHLDEIAYGLNQKGINILADLADDDKETISQKLNGSMLLMGSMDGVYINLVGILFQLMENPEIVDKLRNELDDACITVGNERTIDDEILKDPAKLPYLNCIIKEGLRFISSAPILPRYTQKGIHTENINIPPHSTI